MRREYIIGEILDNAMNKRGNYFGYMVGQRCWLEDDTLKEGNKLIIERKCKEPFIADTIIKIEQDECCIWVETAHESFRFYNCCDLNKTENANPPITESVGTKDSVVGGISIKVNVDTSEIDAAIEKLERLINLSTMIPSSLLNNK